MDREAKNQTILVVDDEEVVRQTYLDVLTQKTPPLQLESVCATVPVESRLVKARRVTAYSWPSGGAEAIAMIKGELAAGRRIAAGFFDMRMPGYGWYGDHQSSPRPGSRRFTARWSRRSAIAASTS